jgi:hypothetical protein
VVRAELKMEDIQEVDRLFEMTRFDIGRNRHGTDIKRWD